MSLDNVYIEAFSVIHLKTDERNYISTLGGPTALFMFCVWSHCFFFDTLNIYSMATLIIHNRGSKQ